MKIKHRALILTILLAFFCQTTYGQLSKKQLNLIHYEYGGPWRFGFSLGLNVFDFSAVSTQDEVTIGGKSYQVRADVTTQKMGFDINAIVNYRLTPQWTLRSMPGVCFGSRKLDFFDERDSVTTVLKSLDIGSNYAELPIQIKFSAKRHSNVRPYVFSGVNIRHSLTSLNDTGIGLNRSEIFGEFGFGFEFYLPYFRFGIEAKFSMGCKNVLNNLPKEGYEPYHNAIDKLKSNLFMIKLNFE